ncbi:MAG: hypothetical protein SX243_13580 [Acidobacteriota bacterium]|nr:hypothetical protein [Acidobacteriota bacterium]
MRLLDDTGLPPDVLALLGEGGVGGSLHLVLRNASGGYTAIRNSDMDLVREVCILTAAALGSTLSGWAPSAIVALIFLFVDVRKKGIVLSVDQGVVLNEIRCSPGLSAKQVSFGVDIEEAVVRDLLETLLRVPRSNGEEVALVKKADGAWYPLDV